MHNLAPYFGLLRSQRAEREKGKERGSRREGKRSTLGTMLSVNKSLCPNEDHGNLFQTVFILFFTTSFWTTLFAFYCLTN